MNRRVAASVTPRTATLPVSQLGAVTWTLGAPKMSRATCCRISATPQVTSSVSRGRPYNRRISRCSSDETHQAGDHERDRQGDQDGVLAPATPLEHVRDVGASHDELAVRHVDHAHLTEGEGQAERDEQKHGADVHAGHQMVAMAGPSTSSPLHVPD